MVTKWRLREVEGGAGAGEVWREKRVKDLGKFLSALTSLDSPGAPSDCGFIFRPFRLNLSPPRVGRLLPLLLILSVGGKTRPGEGKSDQKPTQGVTNRVRAG